MIDFPFTPIADHPLFRADETRRALFYAPGYVVAVPAENADAFERHLVSDEPPQWAAISELRRHAIQAEKGWHDLLSRPFTPVCLTLYLNNECNLLCRYCYAMPSSRHAPRLRPEVVAAAADTVARNCLEQNRPFTVVFHGGGEPALDQPFAEHILDTVESVARRYGLSLLRYIATNGTMSEQKATWLAERFDMVGLSCDGPADIQNSQRPRLGGGDTAKAIERTARIIHAAGKTLHVRVTVTRDSAARQPEIADYICAHLRPAEIHVEPVYRVGRGEQDETALRDAEGFTRAFLEARAIARRWGVPWLNSGSRPGEIHGPYCHVMRDVLQLVPGEIATTCLKTTDRVQADAGGYTIGGSDGHGGFTIYAERIAAIRSSLAATPDSCQSCFNRYHCVRACPEYCPVTDNNQRLGSFRCQVHQLLANALIRETATSLPVGGNGIAGAPVHLS